MNSFTGITIETAASFFDADFIVCVLMIIGGYVAIKKRNIPWQIMLGRIVFALGWSILAWMILWHITPGFMAGMIYGLRI